jgi:hypothetical protein
MAASFCRKAIQSIELIVRDSTCEAIRSRITV